VHHIDAKLLPLKIYLDAIRFGQPGCDGEVFPGQSSCLYRLETDNTSQRLAPT